MIDSETSFDTIFRQFAIHNNILLKKIISFAANNVDETILKRNKNWIFYRISNLSLRIEKHTITIRFYIIDINKSIILSSQWLYTQNSEINWTKEQIRFRD